MLRSIIVMGSLAAAVIPSPVCAATTLVTSATSRGILMKFDPGLGTLLSVHVQHWIYSTTPYGLFSVGDINPPYDVRITADQTVVTPDYGISVRLLIDRTETVGRYFYVSHNVSGERTFTSNLEWFTGKGILPNTSAWFNNPLVSVLTTDNVAALPRLQDCPRGCGGHSTTITYTYDAGVFGAVPEPATWATMIAGFAMIGTGLRRRPATRLRVAAR